MAHTRDEVIAALKRNPKTEGMTDAQIAVKADEYLARTASSAPAKPAPKAAPPAKAAPKADAAKTPEPPKPSPAVAAQVPKVGAKVYGVEPPPRPSAMPAAAPTAQAVHARGEDRPGPIGEFILAHRDDPNPLTTLATSVASPVLSRVAESRADTQAKVDAYNQRGTPPAPPAPPSTGATRYVDPTRFSDMGYGLPSAEKMRAELKAKRPESAAKLDRATDEDVAAVYAKVIGG